MYQQMIRTQQQNQPEIKPPEQQNEPKLVQQQPIIAPAREIVSSDGDHSPPATMPAAVPVVPPQNYYPNSFTQASLQQRGQAGPPGAPHPPYMRHPPHFQQSPQRYPMRNMPPQMQQQMHFQHYLAGQQRSQIFNQRPGYPQPPPQRPMQPTGGNFTQGKEEQFFDYYHSNTHILQQKSAVYRSQDLYRAQLVCMNQRPGSENSEEGHKDESEEPEERCTIEDMSKLLSIKLDRYYRFIQNRYSVQRCECGACKHLMLPFMVSPRVSAEEVEAGHFKYLRNFIMDQLNVTGTNLKTLLGKIFGNELGAIVQRTENKSTASEEQREESLGIQNMAP